MPANRVLERGGAGTGRPGDLLNNCGAAPPQHHGHNREDLDTTLDTNLKRVNLFGCGVIRLRHSMWRSTASVRSGGASREQACSRVPAVCWPRWRCHRA